MIEIAGLALAVSVAVVFIARVVMLDHHPEPKGWKHIREHGRVYYMGAGHRR